MKLTELFAGDRQITSDAGKTQQNIGKTDVVNRQIRSMVPGQTIQGEVVSRNGSEVQIRLSDDLILQAKLDQNMNLEVGKNMTFEVKNNGKALVLSPLFTNMATDANVVKALDMASLPINGTTVALTKQLMEAGLSIDRNTLQQVYREVNLFPKAQTSDIVNLHKMQMPVNESNVSQMASYRNLTHQLVTGMNNVLDAIPDMFSQVVESGDTEGAIKLYQQLVLLAGEGVAEGNLMHTGPLLGGNVEQTILPDGGTVLAHSILIGEESVQGSNIQGNVPENTQDNIQGNTHGNVMQNNSVQGVPIQISNLSAEALMNTTAATLEDDGTIFTNMQGEASSAETVGQGAQESAHVNAQPNGPETLTSNEMPVIRTGTQANTMSAEQISQQMQSIIRQFSADAGSTKELLNPLLQLLKQQWTITPEQVADSEQVEGLYRKLDKQLKTLAEAMENSGQTASTAYKAVTNMTQNLDFLQQVNQLYTYVQLPLRLQNGEAHGDLYVYTNKKHLAAKDGQISALLHLDMEHLGPVDVYVSMVSERVNTRFYLKDDDMLDFLMEHMDILTERLRKRGYQCNFEMQVRQSDEEAKTGIQRLLEQENHMPLAEYAFDVRT